jgi:predicted alpha/beta hydrolase family esterase
MKKQILFLQGGGEDGYEADQQMVASLQHALGNSYDILYPRLPSNEELPDFGWIEKIREEINQLDDGAMIVAHSLGASMLLKYLSEQQLKKNIAALFLIGTPFWSGDEKWVQGLRLRADFAALIPKNIPINFYQARDDEEVPFTHFENYRQQLPTATFHEIENGGHQLNNDLTIIANQMRQP